MDCELFLSLISNSLDNELTGNLRDEFMSHAKICATCRRELLSAERIREKCGEIADAPLPENFKQNMILHLKNERRKQAFSFGKYSYIAAGLVLALVIGSGIMLGRQTPPAQNGGNVLVSQKQDNPAVKSPEKTNDTYGGAEVESSGSNKINADTSPKSQTAPTPAPNNEPQKHMAEDTVKNTEKPNVATTEGPISALAESGQNIEVNETPTPAPSITPAKDTVYGEAGNYTKSASGSAPSEPSAAGNGGNNGGSSNYSPPNASSPDGSPADSSLAGGSSSGGRSSSDRSSSASSAMDISTPEPEKTVSEMLDEMGIAYTKKDGVITVHTNEDGYDEITKKLNDKSIKYTETRDGEGNIDLVINDQ